MDAEHAARMMQVAQFSQRLQQALERSGLVPKQGRGRIDATASLLETSISTTQRMLSGVAMPEAHRLARISEKLGVTIDFLLGLATLEESDRLMRQRAGQEILIPEAEYLAIPILNPGDDPEAERYIYAGRSRVARFIQPVEAAAMIMMKGESMAPTLLDGELILIARQPYTGGPILAEGLYPLYSKERQDWTVRRIQPVAGGMYALTCDNAHYPPVTIPQHALTVSGDYEWSVGGRLRTVLKRY